jgi:nitric oxide reductase large subunit
MQWWIIYNYVEGYFSLFFIMVMVGYFYFFFSLINVRISRNFW